MKINQRVKHHEFGLGTVIFAMFEGTFREQYLIQFDEPNEKLHEGIIVYGKKDSCYWLREKEVEVLEDENS